MIGAILLGLVCGALARMLVPGDVFRHMSGPTSWLVSIGLGLLGALVGYLIFTVLLGIGDTDIFDWGGLLSALIGTVIVVGLASYFLRRRQSHEATSTPRHASQAPPPAGQANTQAPPPPSPPQSPAPPPTG